MNRGDFLKFERWRILAGLGAALSFCFAASAQTAPRQFLHGHVPAVVERFHLQPIGRLPGTNQLSLAIGLPLRNQAALDELLRQLYDPHSTNFHKFLTPQEFTARFGPTERDYQAVMQFAESNGLKIAGTHPDRVVLDVEGSASNVESALRITLRTYHHPTEPRDFFTPDTEPSVPTNLPVADVEGLSDFGRPQPLAHPAKPPQGKPLSGSGPSGYYMGNDFRNAYAPGSTLDGAGQAVGLLEFSAYYQVDITNYENTIGLTNYVPLNNVLVGQGPPPSTANNAEVALDIEMAIAMARNLSQVIVYESGSKKQNTILSRMASDNLAKQLSCSWSWSGGPNSTTDSLFQKMAAQGQSFFQASGDSDAYTGANTLDNSSVIDAPVDSNNITTVGGTTLTMNGSGGSWSSETVWNYASYGGSYANTGSGGGSSIYYFIPWWQTNMDMTVNLGSTTYRNIPDVALTANDVFVDYNNGSSGGFAGTSCAAPLWAGFCALVNQRSMASSGTTVGFLNPALYAIGAGTNYAACFHDTTTGNNIGTNTPGLFYAVAGYDLCTGLGTPNGTNLINALAPATLPYFITQPSSQTATNGNNVSFGVTADGQSPLSYQWLFDGTNLPPGGNAFGVTSNTLTLTAVTSANAGNYSVVVTNSYGAMTSSVAILTVIFPPSFATQPTNQIVLAGGNALFSATVTGCSPLAYQWRQNGTNLVNGGNLSGATSNVLTLASVTATAAGNYMLVATNIYGSATSSVATLTVLLPAIITVPPVAQTIQCGSNASFTVTAAGTAPLKYQWSLDGAAIAAATNTSLSLTNVHLPSHTVAVVVTNLYGSATSSVLLTVQDTLAPVITLNSTNPFYVDLDGTYTDPGATAYDLCVGVVPVITNGLVNTSAVSTNTVTYTAADGNSNTNIATRTVIVRDITPPTISWSFTNLVLTADSNCVSAMPDVTGINYILATDLSGALTITQNPTNSAVLPLGTNTVVITVADASGNKSCSTNSIAVRDITPPVITLNGFNPTTNGLGAAFTDPGVTASDTCSGIALLNTNGTVNVNAASTNTVTYTATDGSGNTNIATRTVIVQDITPPTVLWTFTNLVLAANTNCVAVMSDVTGTNFIQATDLSGVAAISQSPTNSAILPLGTNVVVIAVADAYDNTAYSTNQIIVQDQTPPVILIQPQNQTNNVGTTANFGVGATACTPLVFQWFFNNAALMAQTNDTLTLSDIDSTAAGNYFVVASAGGGSMTSSIVTLTVNPISPAIALASSENPSGFKDSLSFTASLAPTNVTGTIQFLTNGATFDIEPLVAGIAGSTNLSSLPRGTNVVAAVYSGDANDLPATNTLAQIVTNHPPAAADVFYSRQAGYPLDIAVADLATNWSDADGDTLSLADIGVSTNGVTVTNDAGTLVYFDTNDVDDQFVCTISDGWGGTNFQTVHIVIVLANATPDIAVMPSGSNGTVALILGGAPGYTYVLEATTNLLPPANWLPMATNTLGTNGVWLFTDPQVMNFPQRFYRLKLAQ